jgi:hypothetical protein
MTCQYFFIVSLTAFNLSPETGFVKPATPKLFHARLDRKLNQLKTATFTSSRFLQLTA